MAKTEKQVAKPEDAKDKWVDNTRSAASKAVANVQKPKAADAMKRNIGVFIGGTVPDGNPGFRHWKEEVGKTTDMIDKIEAGVTTETAKDWFDNYAEFWRRSS